MKLECGHSGGECVIGNFYRCIVGGCDGKAKPKVKRSSNDRAFDGYIMRYRSLRSCTHPGVVQTTGRYGEFVRRCTSCGAEGFKLL